MSFFSTTQPTGLGIFDGIVGKIIVLSLPDADERRRRLPDHLAKFGITEFEWHDACSPDHPDVRALYDSGRVAQYPPCFRCGATDCDCENNTLIPQQVANFVSHIAIWKKTRAFGKPVLVLEDDVVLHPWAGRIARRLRSRIRSGKIDFRPETEMLLRLGWPRSSEKSRDHRAFRLFKASTRLRMSNPCYALTPAFAERAISMFDGAKTTSDIYLHQIVPNDRNALTIQPALASELSWSEGAVDSSIHPKTKRLDYLSKHGLWEEREKHEKRLRQHIAHIYHRPILCVGHPRTGTKYVASVCSQAGLDVGHEKGGADGISSWMFAVDAEESPWALDPVARTRLALRWKTMIQTVRDPETAIPSIIRENLHAPASYEFRRHHIKERTGIDLDTFETDVEKAVASMCLWARIIREQNPDFVFHIETDSASLIDYLRSEGYKVSQTDLDTAPVNSDKLYKGAHHEKPLVRDAEWGEMGTDARGMLIEYCETYGYRLPRPLLGEKSRLETDELKT